jgi:hypothetical protein
MGHSGIQINKQAIRKMMRDIQREMDKHPVKVRTEAVTPEPTPLLPRVPLPGGNTFHGPVVFGNVNGPLITGDVKSGAQLAWGNTSVSQNQSSGDQIAPGFEAIAQAVVDALRHLPAMGVSEEEIEDAAAIGEEVLNEVVQAEPDRGRIRRAVAALKGYFAPIATRAVAAGAVTGSEETARAVIERLSTAF